MHQLINPNSLDLSLILLLIGLAFLSASLSVAFNQFLKPGMIFNWYAKWLETINQYIAKPLGLCPYCNGTWIGITIYLYYFKLSLPIFLFIGINWLFIFIIYNFVQNVKPRK